MRRGGVALADEDDFGEVAVEVDAITAVQGVDPDALLQADVGEVGGVFEKLSFLVHAESAEGSYVDVGVALGSEEVAVGGKSPSAGVKFLGFLDSGMPVSGAFAVRQQRGTLEVSAMSFRKREVAVGLVRIDVFEEIELGVLLLGGAAKPADPAGECLGPVMIARAAHDRRDADEHV